MMVLKYHVQKLMHVAIKAIGMIQTDVVFFQHMLIVVTSATIGFYLFGNNTRIPLSDG